MKEEAKKKERDSLILYGDDDADIDGSGENMDADGGLL